MDSTPLFPAITSRSPEETVKAGADFATRLSAGDVVAVHGDLGAGKTTFVRGLVRALMHPSSRESTVVTSPTFSIVHTYSTGDVVVHHVDAFRVESEAELDELGFDEYLDGSAVVIVEWPTHIGSRLPHNAFHVTLQHMEDGVRHISAGSPNTPRYDRDV